jgi:hypothetical protein
MPYFMNPFKKHDGSEFPGVLVPLQQSVRPASATSVVHGIPASSPMHKDEKADKEEKADSDSASGVTGSVPGGFTIEQLKAEIEADMAASGSPDTAYDRMLRGFSCPLSQSNSCW